MDQVYIKKKTTNEEEWEWFSVFLFEFNLVDSCG